MGKIQSLQGSYNYGRVPYGLQKTKKHSPVAFKGGNGIISDLTKEEQNVVDKALTSYTGKVKGPFFNMLSNSSGEIQNLIIMNLGTAGVAPFFIINNPLSKDSKKKKEYVAMRQPISALIAATFGIGINIPVPNYVEKYLMKGKIKSMDLSIIPQSGYCNKMYKKIKNNIDDVIAPETEKTSSKVKEWKKFYNLAIDSAKSTAKSEGRQLTEILTKEDFVKEFSNKKVFEDAVVDASAKNYAKKLLEDTNPDGLKNITVKDYLIQNLGFKEDYADKDCLNEIATKKRLQELSADDLAKALGFEYSSKDIHTFVANDIYKKESNLSSQDRKVISRLAKEDAVLPAKDLLIATNLRNDFATNKELLNTKMDKFLLDFNKRFDVASAVAATDTPEEHAKKIAKGIIKEAKSLTSDEILLKLSNGISIFKSKAIKSNYGAYKKYQGIILSLATLPLSCGLLNFAYPKVMKSCFPGLTKASEGSSNVEVKKEGGKN